MSDASTGSFMPRDSSFALLMCLRLWFFFFTGRLTEEASRHSEKPSGKHDAMVDAHEMDALDPSRWTRYKKNFYVHVWNPIAPRTVFFLLLFSLVGALYGNLRLKCAYTVPRVQPCVHTAAHVYAPVQATNLWFLCCAMPWCVQVHTVLCCCVTVACDV